jgi:hypothetical protein
MSSLPDAAPHAAPAHREGSDFVWDDDARNVGRAGRLPTRALYVRWKMSFVFGDRGKPQGALTMIMKLPVSADMVQDLKFMPESRAWFRQHDWVIARFGSEEDILAHMPTLKAWLAQGYCALAPKTFACVVRGKA